MNFLHKKTTWLCFDKKQCEQKTKYIEKENYYLILILFHLNNIQLLGHTIHHLLISLNHG